MLKRLLSLALVVLLTLSCLPVTAVRAAEQENPAPAEENAIYTEEAAPDAETENPVEETTAPTEETEASVEETTVPTEETEAATEEATVPAEEGETPAEDTEVPEEETIPEETETVVPVEEEVYTSITKNVLFVEKGSDGLYTYTNKTITIERAVSQGDTVSYSLAGDTAEPFSDQQRMGTPTNLTWGVDYRFSDGRAMPGSIAWKPAEPNQGEFLIEVFREGESEACGSYWWSFDNAGLPEWLSVPSFAMSDPESGSYYFTVTALSVDDNFYDSETVRSEAWTYTKPTARVGTCSDISWNGPEFSWKGPAEAGGYEIQFLYAQTESAAPKAFMSGWVYYSDFSSYTLRDEVFQSLGSGYYYASVRALSADITAAGNGEWSDLGDPYYFNADENSEVPETPSVLEMPFTEWEWEVLKLVNKERQKEGLDPLTGFTTLQEATYIRTGELQESFSHTRPDGTSCFTALDEVGLSYGAAGENIAFGYRSPADVMNGWMNSEGHRANILKPGYAHLGVGESNYYWTQMFLSGGKYTSIYVVVPNGIPVAQGTTIEDMDLVAVLNSSVYGECYLPVLSSYCTGFDPDLIGDQKVTISVLGVTATFEITAGMETIPMYRLYNPYTQEHLFISNEQEKESLLTVGWLLDGLAWYAPTSGDPVYRLYNPYDDWHFYSMSQEEIDNLTSLGWKVDGVVCYSSSEQAGDPIYRLFNPYEKTNYHLFTMSVEERDWLITLGWQLEGVAWYGISP